MPPFGTKIGFFLQNSHLFLSLKVSILGVYCAQVLCPSQLTYNQLKRQTFGSKFNVNIGRIPGSTEID